MKENVGNILYELLIQNIDISVFNTKNIINICDDGLIIFFKNFIE